MRVEKDFRELLELFNKHKVRYVIVGAFAVAFHGRPRYTKDLDILIEPRKSNAEKIIKALDEFGFKSLKLEVSDFTKKGNIIQLGYEPIRIDLITYIKGFHFSRLWRNRRRGEYGGLNVNFVGMNDIIKMKRLAKRENDLSDLDALLRIKRGKG